MHATAYKHINKTGTNIYKQAQAYKGKRQPSKRTQHANNGKPQTDPNKGTVAAVKSAPHPRGGRGTLAEARLFAIQKHVPRNQSCPRILPIHQRI